MQFPFVAYVFLFAALGAALSTGPSHNRPVNNYQLLGGIHVMDNHDNQDDRHINEGKENPRIQLWS